MSDPECFQFFAHPRVSEMDITKEEREGEGLVPGMEVVEAVMTMRGRALCCVPVQVCG
jgi:hypothetical protein